MVHFSSFELDTIVIRLVLFLFLIICCHLVLILPAPYSHMMLAWARVGDGQLDSDLDKMSSYLLRLCNFDDLTFIGLL